MFDYKNFKKEISSITPDLFNQKALELFSYQFATNTVYRHFCMQLGKSPEDVGKVEEIPFLPIEFFKTQKVVSDHWAEEKIFKSSGTTMQQRSRHWIKELDFYHSLARKAFEDQYGSLSEYQIIALLPSYLEQGDSSLISMVDHFIRHAAAGSNYYLHETLPVTNPTRQKRLLIGVSYALLDLCEQVTFDDPYLTVMETGGMKGRRREMIKEELHEVLKSGLGVQVIHSEYGMTELTSQAYGADGFLKFPHWVKVLIRDINDPFSYVSAGKAGGLNIIDLGNVHTCAFIETQDLGKIAENNYFKVLGRFDNADIRGCNLLL